MTKIDNVLKFGLALVIPKIIFLILKWTNENGGGAAITSLLNNISLNIGMEEGVGVFVIIGLISYGVSEHFVAKYFEKKIERERKDDKLLVMDILKRIDTYPISKSLKKKLKFIYIDPILPNK